MKANENGGRVCVGYKNRLERDERWGGAARKKGDGGGGGGQKESGAGVRVSRKIDG